MKIGKRKVWIPLSLAAAALALLLAQQGGLFGKFRADRPPEEYPPATRPAGEAADSHHEDEVVRLHEEELEEFGITLEEAGSGTIEVELTLPGEVVVDPGRLAHIVPRAPGIARAVEKRLGTPVRAGEVLAWLESAELGEAKAAYLAARSRLELAETDLAREKAVHRNTTRLLELLRSSPSFDALKETEAIALGENRSRLIGAYAEYLFAEAAFRREKRLFEKKISSEGDYLDAERAYKKAHARYITERDSIAFAVNRALLEVERAREVAELALKAAERRLHILGLREKELAGFASWIEDDEKLSWYALRAPFGGVVIAKHITTGERLDGDDTVFAVADLRTVWVEITVYQRDLEKVREGQPVLVYAGPGGPQARGRIDYVSPMVDESTRTATARAVLANAEGAWRPGMFVNARITVERAEVPLVVPRTALQTVAGRTVVFVRTGEGFEPRPVETGRADTRFVEVKDGLAPGAVYAATNAFTLKAELNKDRFGGEGHAH